MKRAGLLTAAIKLAAVFVSGSMGVGICQANAQQSYIIHPDQDAWVNEANPSANYGSNTYMSLKDRSGLAEAYIRFSQDELGALIGKPIIAASLYLYQYLGTNSPGDSIALHRVSAAWDESTVSWDTRPMYDIEQISSVAISGETNTLGWREWGGLEAVVAGWEKGNNYGLALENNKDMVNGELYARFYSSEYSNAAFRPYLKVTAAPEPIGLALFTLGGGILAARCKARKKL